ncbi:Gfo/Idh/MocA family oxidoreductase [Alkalicaulis satelles]|uniref:Gfo/Idh/MocA family oxidoreductase n=1 Tax=Alkalicaulis satelles TaxID=2609175 RepID=A0A5M6ZK42_9PROT|nr:Gfo/Idh/MocA family oxidoreductase [Alkalicaulis satelles]KAA5805202.1 Gfo/Idh/MocA family oxidoreductase [Alkalicaulis satelles]
MNQTSSPLRAGVVGAGVFGGYHAGKYASAPGVSFQGVFDPVSDRAGAVSEAHGGKAFDSLQGLIESCDVITVASPAIFHHDAVRRALLADRAVLVEKPLAATLEEARALADLARARGLVLRVGHQERFVFNAMGLFGDLPHAQTLSARRMGVPSARNLDVSVTLDLMIHDIDLVLALAGSAPDRVDAQMDAGRAGLADHIRCRLSFPGGLVAELESSRVAEARDRVMEIGYQGGAHVRVDFIAKTFDSQGGLALNPDFADAPEARDSLGANVAAFLDAVRGSGAGGPAADGEAGWLALETALRIDEAAGARSRI